MESNAKQHYDYEWAISGPHRLQAKAETLTGKTPVAEIQRHRKNGLVELSEAALT